MREARSLLLFLYLVQKLLLIESDDSIPSFSCPAYRESPPIQVPSNTLINIKKTKDYITYGSLCTLTRVTGNLESFAQVARSYDGFDWENVAGPYSSSLDIECPPRSNYCTLQVPNVTSDDQSFELVKYEYGLHPEDELARFFEQSTFGTTRKDLRAVNPMNYNNLLPYFSSWVHDQIYTTTPTLHREIWRSRALPRKSTAHREGAANHPCEVGARWRSVAFDQIDIHEEMTVTMVNDALALSINGHIRTMMKNIEFQSRKISFDRSDLPATFQICGVSRSGPDSLRVIHNDKCESIRGGNPRIDLEGMADKMGDPPTVFHIDENSNSFVTEIDSYSNSIELILMTNKRRFLKSANCTSLHDDGRPVFAQLRNGQSMIFDSRLILQTNTLEDPLQDGGGKTAVATGSKTKCSNVPRSFLNDHSCRISSADDTCTNIRDGEEFYIQLDASTILRINDSTGRYVHAIKGLNPDDSTLDFPCDSNARSRWVSTPLESEICHGDIQETTADAFRNLIKSSTDPNPLLKDIYFDTGFCHENDINRRKLHVLIEGVCWTNVHPNEYDVYDFSDWALNHPGGSWAIYQFVENATEFLTFPENHEMWRWQDNHKDFPLFGRLGDSISADNLLGRTRESVVDGISHLLRPDLNGPGVIVCGSPGEISNMNPYLLTFDMNLNLSPPDDTMAEYEPKQVEAFLQSRKDVWTMATLTANDQLRQRMAWALSQILAISPESFEDTLSTEMFTSFYDIFVRNAFGNYNDILREVSYSPMMAEMLTYIGSQSQEYIFTTMRRVQYADENYAREIMQLFSIGLVKLNIDGTPELDDNGNQVKTYTNDEIEEYARAWTGFTRQEIRGNIEQQEDGLNSIDPMIIKVHWRDVFPKMGLNGQYVGDGYMLCSDIPQKAFLREGATYRLLGKTKLSEVQNLHLRDSQAQSDIHVTLLSNESRLRNILCDRRGAQCQYPATVVIPSTIDCDGAECGLDQVQVVEVGENIYYEYIKPPCVVQTFFGSKRGALVKYDSDSSPICVDKSVASASAACCRDDQSVATHDSCKYTGERVPFHEAEARCISNGMTTCAFDSIDESSCQGCCNYNGPYWYDGSENCDIRAIINIRGEVALERQDSKRKNYESLTFFRVHWESDYPSAENDCGEKICELVSNHCRCKVENLSKVAFSDTPQKEEVLTYLHVGGVSPSLMDYPATEEVNDMKIHYGTAVGKYDKNVIFEVTDEFGRTRYLKNVVESVKLATRGKGGVKDAFVFRNPPTFLSMLHPEVRDAQYETEAVIDHVLYHKNTAPFLARRLIQRFGISNPSPRFVKTVAEAFCTGTYVKEMNSFGTGLYGDLAATIAAILLDRESRRVILDEDPSFGSIREPLIKFTALMRNMEYVQTSTDKMLGLYHAGAALGEMAHEIPSVFSFFLPEYSPPGAVSKAGLVAPEALLWHKTIGMMNGLLSMVKFGLTSCYEGLGNGDKCSRIQEGEYVRSMGHLTYNPPDDYAVENIVDELATLLTSGRMSRVNRDIVRDTYLSVYSQTDDQTFALRIAQQLMVTSAEFHANVLTTNTPRLRDTDEMNAKKTCKKYKSVIHILLQGGMDSYNLLVPHSKCTEKVSYDQYAEVRGPVSLPKESLLQINASSSAQPCEVFGLHQSMPFLKKLYDEGDASFFAGIGVLSEPVTKDNYNTKTKTSLFAHNAMQAEIGRLDPLMSNKGTGVLGRITDVLSSKGYSVNSFAVNMELKALEGKLNSNKIPIDSSKGFVRFNPADSDSGDLIGLQAERINGKVEGYTSAFSDTWSTALHTSRQFEEFYWAQEYANLTAVGFSRQKKLRSIAQMIGSSECRGSDRDLFILRYGGYDNHNNLIPILKQELHRLNEGLEVFVEEMKAQNVWEDVTIVVSSDFGRTLSGNSASGTDHAWSGHSFILGGAVDGGKIHGHYPSDLSETSPLRLKRGRMIPEFPWETMWHPVVEWLGIEDEDDANYVLPNRLSFPKSALLQKDDVFQSSSNSNKSPCEGEGEPVTCRPQTGAVCDPSDPYCLTVSGASLHHEVNITILMSVFLIASSFFF